MQKTIRDEFTTLCREVYGKDVWLNRPISQIPNTDLSKDIDVLRGLAAFTRSRVWKAMKEHVRA